MATDDIRSSRSISAHRIAFETGGSSIPQLKFFGHGSVHGCASFGRLTQSVTASDLLQAQDSSELVAAIRWYKV